MHIIYNTEYQICYLSFMLLHVDANLIHKRKNWHNRNLKYSILTIKLRRNMTIETIKHEIKEFVDRKKVIEKQRKFICSQ